MKPNCLIVDDMHLSILKLMEEAGIETDYEPTISKEEIIERIDRYEGIIVRGKIKIDLNFLSNAKKLKYIGRAGAGKDNIDIQAAEQLGITILNAPEGNRDAVAEHTIGMMLNLLNKINSADKEVKNNIWKREANRGTELGSQTVGIIGYGNTGREVSKRLIGFGCKILAYDIRGISHFEQGIHTSSMESIFNEADIISLHIPLDSHNRNLVNQDFLGQFKKNIWIINTARGEILNTADLLNGLESGKILGAGLDVLENEKLETLSPTQKRDFDLLCSLPNVLITPHVAGWTHDSYRKISETIARKISQFYHSNTNIII